MNTRFAVASVLAAITAAARNPDHLTLASRQKVQMQSCIDRIDFAHPNALVQVDNCNIKAKKMLRMAHQQNL